MTCMRKNARIYLVAFAFFLAGLGYLVYAGFGAGSSYHLDVAEALDMPENELHNVRLFGTVGLDGVERGQGGLGVAFMLRDQHSSTTILRVEYAGAVPDGFKPGVELYAEGSMAVGKQVFKARGLTTTCPSKYRKENRK